MEQDKPERWRIQIAPMPVANGTRSHAQAPPGVPRSAQGEQSCAQGEQSCAQGEQSCAQGDDLEMQPKALEVAQIVANLYGPLLPDLVEGYACMSVWIDGEELIPCSIHASHTGRWYRLCIVEGVEIRIRLSDAE